MRHASALSYDELANKVIGMDESLAHLIREERDKVIRQQLRISRAVLRELRGDSDWFWFSPKKTNLKK